MNLLTIPFLSGNISPQMQGLLTSQATIMWCVGLRTATLLTADATGANSLRHWLRDWMSCRKSGDTEALLIFWATPKAQVITYWPICGLNQAKCISYNYKTQQNLTGFLNLALVHEGFILTTRNNCIGVALLGQDNSHKIKSPILAMLPGSSGGRGSGFCFTRPLPHQA